MSRENPAAREAGTEPVPAMQGSSRWIPLAMASALFMDLLDTSALGTALPTLARNFHTEPLQLRFALTSYLMTMAVCVPASGWMADRFGPRRVFINAIWVYLLGSLCCGLADSVAALVAARMLQGVGGAMMTPIARLIVVATTRRERLVQALNTFTTAAVVGPLLGPPLAGFLLEWANWRWIFFINLPVGAIGILSVLRIVPRLRHRHPGKFDGIGFGLAAVAIISVIVLAETIGTNAVPAGLQAGLALAGVVAVMSYVLHARRCDKPILDLHLFKGLTYRTSMLGGALIRVGISATPFLIPLLLQVALGWSPMRCGFATMSLMLGSMVARYGGTLSIRLMGFRKTLLLTAVLTALATMGPAGFSDSTPTALIIGVMIAGAFFRATHFVASSALAFADVRAEELSRASTLSTVIQQLSYSLGISMAGLSLELSAQGTTHYTVENFGLPFALVGFTALLAVPLYLRLGHDAGAAMRNGDDSRGQREPRLSMEKHE